MLLALKCQMIFLTSWWCYTVWSHGNSMKQPVGCKSWHPKGRTAFYCHFMAQLTSERLLTWQKNLHDVGKQRLPKKNLKILQTWSLGHFSSLNAMIGDDRKFGNWECWSVSWNPHNITIGNDLYNYYEVPLLTVHSYKIYSCRNEDIRVIRDSRSVLGLANTT